MSESELLMEAINAFVTNEYFYFRQRVPIFIYIFYLHFKNKNNQGAEKIIRWGLSFVVALLSYAFIGLIMDIPFKKFIPLNWRYSGLITWGVFFLCYYYISRRITNKNLTSFTLATIATFGGGWLHEIPFYYPLSMLFNHFSIYYLDTQFFCLLLLAYELRNLNFKPNKIIYAALTLYLVFSTILYFDYLYFIDYLWIYRIPTCLFLLSLLGGIQMEDKK